MKTTFVSMLLVLLHLAVFSQFREVGKSQPFVEPEEGYARILQLKNGNTALIVVTKKDGIDMRLYDDQYQNKLNKKLSPRYGKLEKPTVEGMFEVNGDVVCLIQDHRDNVPTLFRLVIDGSKGVIRKEDVVGELPKISKLSWTKMEYNRQPLPDFYVKKDPDSDHYGIVLFNSTEPDRSKRVEVVTFTPGHEISGRSYLAFPQQKYQFITYLDMAFVNGDALVFGYGFSEKGKSNKQNTMLVGSLKAGSRKMEVKEVKFTHNLEVKSAITKFNKASGNFLVLMFIPTSGNYGEIWMADFDPRTLDVVKKEEAYFSGPAAAAKALFGKKGDFRGTPVNLFVHADGSYSIALEEISYMNSGNYNSVLYATVGSLVIADFDKEGRFTRFYYLPKEHVVSSYRHDEAPKAFYHHYMENAAWPLYAGNQFKSFVYLRNAGNPFVLYNDFMENREGIAAGKIKTVRWVSECDAYRFALNDQQIPTGELFFGLPAKNQHNLALFPVSAYNPDKNRYVTLRLITEERNKSVQLVWMEI